MIITAESFSVIFFFPLAPAFQKHYLLDYAWFATGNGKSFRLIWGKNVEESMLWRSSVYYMSGCAASRDARERLCGRVPFARPDEPKHAKKILSLRADRRHFLQFNSRISTWPRRSHTIMHFLQRFPALKNSRISYFAAFYPYRKNHSFAPIIHLYCVFHSALSCARVFKVYSIQLVFAGVLSWLQATRTSSVWYFMELLWKRKYIFSISIWQHTQQGKPHIRFQTNR